MIETVLIEKTAAGHVYRRDLYDELCRWLDKEAAHCWPVYHADDGTDIQQIAVTVAEQIIEKWLTEVYQPALLEGGDR
jgi:hypothetical protein